MTATVVPPLPTADELVTDALVRLYLARDRLDKPLTVARIHALQQDLTVVIGWLLTPPLRPRDLTRDLDSCRSDPLHQEVAE